MPGHGDKLFEAVCKLGLEGIVSKKLDAPYKSGPSKAWLKIKNPMERFNNRFTRDGGGGAYGTLARGHFNRCASPVLPRTQLVERLEH